MPKSSPHPHVSWRDGRPRFQPDQNLRKAGYAGTDLRWPETPAAGWQAKQLKPGEKNTGRWFSRGEAVDWSEAFVKKLSQATEAKAAGKPTFSLPRLRPTLYTVGQLFEDWYRSPKFQVPADKAEARRLRAAKVIYADKSIVDFKQKAKVIEDFAPSIWAAPVDALSQPVLFGLYEELVPARGLSTARGAIAIFSMALGWGRRRGKTIFRENQGVNPALNLQMAVPPPRVRFGTRTEIYTLVAVADHLGWHEFGDMTLLGLWSGQRQADRLELEDHGLLKGRRMFRQAKTGAVVAILEAPELEARIAASQERRRAAKAEALLAAAPKDRAAIEKRFRRVILNETVDPRYGRCAWAPFKSQYYSHEFAILRSFAAAGILDVPATAEAARAARAAGRKAPAEAVWIIRPCPTLEDFLEADLRDTAVTWMALAGATIPQIISVTGHTAESATRILKHYLARHPEMADEAIRKMIAWYDADGETELGL
jgi:hypothetical protein